MKIEYRVYYDQYEYITNDYNNAINEIKLIIKNLNENDCEYTNDEIEIYYFNENDEFIKCETYDKILKNG